MNINELEELAKSVTGWSNCDKAWLDTSEDTPAAVFGHIDEDGNTYPVATVDCDQYYSGDSLKLAKFYAATNPSAVLELIAAYREAVAALKETTFALEHRWEVIANRAAPVMEGVIDAAHTTGIQALATAKRLGVE